MGLIVAAAIPLSAMSALIAMKYAGVSANLMSLGAVDFGVIVDGAVGVVVAFTFEIVSISSSRTNFWFSLANLAQISSFFNS